MEKSTDNKTPWIRRLALLSLLLLCAGTLSAAGHNAPTILVIHSYNPEYRWTQDINDGISDQLALMGGPRLVYTEYLDWKRFPDKDLIENIHHHLLEKYRHIPIDVIIVSDDKALEFAVLHRKEAFSDAPIVFTAVYESAVSGLTGGAKNLTGVYEDQDVHTTVRYALTIQQEPRAAYLISDMNESGQAVEARLRAALGVAAPVLPVFSLSDHPIEEIEKILSGLSAKDLVFIGSYSIDKSGTTYTGETLIGRIAAAAVTPVYVLNTHHLGTGALGGHLLSPYLLGSNAGKLATRVLGGKPADEIKPVQTGIFIPKFDWSVVKRFDVRWLPANAQFINKEENFVVKYKKEVAVILLAFLVLLALIQILLVSMRRAKRLAKDLVGRNKEITVIKDRLQESEERYRLSANGSNDALWDWNYATQQIHYSPRWFEITGYSPDPDKAVQIEDIIHPADRPRYDEALESHISRDSEYFTCEVRIRRANGSWKWILIRGRSIWNADGKLSRFAGSITDIDERKKGEAEIENLAFYDQLTSLPNKVLAAEFTRQTLANRPTDRQCGLLFLDLDNFKYVNDTWGHALGDKVLVHVARTLSSLVNEHIQIARFGGDEFIVLVSDTDSLAMDKFTQLVIRLVGRKTEIDGRFHYLSVSAGVALYPDHASNFDELIQKADAALHRAKIAGKTKYCFYNEIVHRELVNRMSLETGLRSAVENNELYVAYQPQICIATGKIEGFEALARWNSAANGEISPGEFIPVAEDTGQIVRVSDFVIGSALKFIKRARSLGYDSFTVSVNISARQLRDADFVPSIIRHVTEEGIDTGRVSLEITESLLIEGIESAVEKLQNLRDAGFKLSLDDFGKGFSSLSYLKLLPIDFIKMDKLFIDDILSEGKTQILAQHIITLSHQLGLRVVAEGVEVKEQLDYLRLHGCDIIQGYYYSKPEIEDTAIGQLELSFE